MLVMSPPALGNCANCSGGESGIGAGLGVHQRRRRRNFHGLRGLTDRQRQVESGNASDRDFDASAPVSESRIGWRSRNSGRALADGSGIRPMA